MTVTNTTDEPDRPPLERLIGFDTLSRPLESWYAFVSRLIRANLLNDVDIRKQLPVDWVRCAFAPQAIQTSDLAIPTPYVDQLPDAQASVLPVAGPDHKSTRARSTGQSRGLGIKGQHPI